MLREEHRSSRVCRSSFFQPLHLHLQPPDLAVQRIGVRPVLDPPPAPPALEQHLESVLWASRFQVAT